MTLPGWETDGSTRLAARDLAGAALVEWLRSGSDVVMPQFFGRLGYIAVLDELTSEHDATFVEVILAMDAALAVDRFRARRRALADQDEHHPEQDIADADVERFIVDAVERLERLPTARPRTHVVPVTRTMSEHEVYRRVCAEVDGS